jgi:hypothetical protein
MRNAIRSVPTALSTLLLVCLTAWAIFNLVQTIHYVAADYSQVPVEDYWRIPQLWANPESIRWSNFWEQHNEHRIIFPELVHVTDMLLLHGRMYLPIAVSGACYLGIWLVLVWAAYSQRVIERPVREAALLLGAVMITWKGCSTVIATPFQLQFTLLQFSSVLALLFLSLLAETKRSRYLACVIGAGVVCTYSSGNGMLMWLILVAAAIWLRISVRQIVILGIAALLFSGAYFYHYRFLPSLMKTNIRHPLQAAAFLCSYFSMPFGGYGPRTFGFKVGAANLIGMAACAWMAWRRGVLLSRLGLVVFGGYLFILLSALLTTGGRMDMNDYLFAQAKAWRYVTMPTASWTLLAIALVWMVATVWSRNWSWVAVVVVVAGCFFVGFRRAGDWLETTRLTAANAQVTATMLRNGVFDSSQVRTIFPDAEFIRVNTQALQEFHKSVFAHGNDKWIGGNLLSLPLLDTPVEGKIVRVVPVPGGLEIMGWADISSLTDDHEILFVNGQNVIVGFGRRPGPGLPANLGAWDVPNPLGFVGYVSLARPMDQLSVYVRTFHGKRIQPLTGTIDLPAFTQLDSRTDSAPLAGISWTRDANWTLRGYDVDPENGPAPPNDIYASWSGSDVKTGQIHSSPFSTPANSCLVLPVLAGRAGYGQSVEVRDADSGQLIASIPFLDGRTIWRRWRIPIPPATKNVTVVADDEGTGPNEWVAVATPEQCQ